MASMLRLDDGRRALGRRRSWGAIGLALLVGAAVACGDGSGDTSGSANGAKCGSATCAADEYCCDAACGLCVPAQVACTETCE